MAVGLLVLVYGWAVWVLMDVAACVGIECLGAVFLGMVYNHHYVVVSKRDTSKSHHVPLPR